MLFWLLLSTVLASRCPLKEAQVWNYYAEEWGHEERPVQILKRTDILIGPHKAQWLLLPKTCTKESCDVSLILAVSAGCWKPLVSVQGKAYPLKKGDWHKFEVVTTASAINKTKTRIVKWEFDFKKLQFNQLTTSF
jgi:hypothetical protein